MKQKLGILLTILAILSMPVLADNLTLAWDPSPDHASVKYYMVHIGNQPGTYSMWTNAQTRTQITITNGILPGRTYYFAVTAVGTNGLESDFSNEVEYKAKVGAPSNLRINL